MLTTVPAPAGRVLHAAEMTVEERDRAQQGAAHLAGIRLPDTLLPVGTALYPSGEAKLAAMRAELAALPDASTLLANARRALALEQARDTRVPIQRVRLLPDSAAITSVERLTDGNSRGGLAYTADGFDDLARWVAPSAGSPAGFASNLRAMDPDLRASWFNRLAERSTRAEQVTLRLVRVPSADGARRETLRAIVSAKHSQDRGDDLAIVDALSATASQLNGAKGRYTREGYGAESTFELVWPSLTREIRVGDVLQVALRISNNEIGSGSLRVEPCVLRTLCANLTTAWSQTLDPAEWTLRHVGDLRRKMPRLIAKAQAAIEPFVRLFGDAYQNPFPTALPTRGEVLARVRKTYALPESTVTLAAQMWDLDNGAGNTLGGLSNALTRAAQELPMAPAKALSDVAGEVVAKGWSALS